jgi:hypothetical protein
LNLPDHDVPLMKLSMARRRTMDHHPRNLTREEEILQQASDGGCKHASIGRAIALFSPNFLAG